MGLVNDEEIFHPVLSRAELLQHLHIFASTPDGVDGNVEPVLAGDEVLQFGKRELIAWETFLDGRLRR